jgi:hypothetical protein
VGDAGEEHEVQHAWASERLLGVAVEFVVELMLDRKLPGHAVGDPLLIGRHVRLTATDQDPDHILSQARFAGYGRVGVALVVGPPRRADRQDDDLPNALAQ